MVKGFARPYASRRRGQGRIVRVLVDNTSGGPSSVEANPVSLLFWTRRTSSLQIGYRFKVWIHRHFRSPHLFRSTQLPFRRRRVQVNTMSEPLTERQQQVL